MTGLLLVVCSMVSWRWPSGCKSARSQKLIFERGTSPCAAERSRVQNEFNEQYHQYLIGRAYWDNLVQCHWQLWRLNRTCTVPDLLRHAQPIVQRSTMPADQNGRQVELPHLSPAGVYQSTLWTVSQQAVYSSQSRLRQSCWALSNCYVEWQQFQWAPPQLVKAAADLCWVLTTLLMCGWNRGTSWVNQLWRFQLRTDVSGWIFSSQNSIGAVTAQLNLTAWCSTSHKLSLMRWGLDGR